MNFDQNNHQRLTQKMAAFASGVAIEKLSLSDAYRAAYDATKMTPKSINDAASKLAAHPAVAQRVQVLSERATAAIIKKAGFTFEASMDEAGGLLEDAKALGQISAGVAAAALRARLAGLLNEKREEKPGALDDVSVQELLALREIVAAQLQRAADALELVGISPIVAPVIMRRVIG